MKSLLSCMLAVLALVCACPAGARAQGPAGDAAARINAVLDAWHAAAARADEEAYFGAFAPDAVFLGTDATERWTVAQFRAYAHPYFAKGKAWTYHPRDRHVAFAPDARTAWFDEALDSPHMGECRGSGVLVLLEGAWRIAHYNLTIPVPNDLAKDFVKRIAEYGAAHAAHAAPPDAGTVRVVTFNLRYANPDDGENRWEKRRDNVAAFLREQHPDVLGLQEALRSQLDDLNAALPEMGQIGVGRDDAKAAGEYAAILYRKDRWKVGEQGTFWFSDTPETPGSKGWGNQVVRICTWSRLEPATGGGGGAFYVFNVHLDHESQASRERSVALLLERIAARATPDPVIVTGDFNAPEDNAAVRAMTREPTPGSRTPRFRDSFRVLHPDEMLCGTFNSFRGETTGPKIDYIFVPEGTRVSEATIHRVRPGDHDLSDHFPVSAVLVLPPRGAAR